MGFILPRQSRIHCHTLPGKFSPSNKQTNLLLTNCTRNEYSLPQVGKIITLIIVIKHSKFPQNKPNAMSFSPTLLSRWLYPNQLRTHWLIQGTRRLFRLLCFLVDFIATNLELIDLSRFAELPKTAAIPSSLQQNLKKITTRWQRVSAVLSLTHAQSSVHQVTTVHYTSAN